MNYFYNQRVAEQFDEILLFMPSYFDIKEFAPPATFQIEASIQEVQRLQELHPEQLCQELFLTMPDKMQPQSNLAYIKILQENYLTKKAIVEFILNYYG